MNNLAKTWETWGGDGYKNRYFNTCWRFRNITERKDWVVVYFDETLHLGQLEGGIVVDKEHCLSKKCELFHYRKVINKKPFPLIELPDPYRLIGQAGRGNVHQHNHIYTRMLEVLAESASPEKVLEY